MFDLKTVGKNIWLMEPDALVVLHRQLAELKERPTAEQIAATKHAASRAMRRTANGQVAVLPIYGLIEQRPSLASYYYGGCSTEDVGQAVDMLLGSRECEAILLDIDSPGGSIYGVEELASKIYDARGKKAIYAVANSMAASAAYWIGTAACQLAVTPGGDVGSVGVYSMHFDYSEALTQEGIKVTIAHAGKYKTEFNPYEPLGDDAKAAMQAQVDGTYTKFVKAVARNRGTQPSEVRAKYGQGRVMGADEALSVGMVDRIASLEEVLGKLGSGGLGRMARSVSAEMLRLRLEHRRRRRPLGLG